MCVCYIYRTICLVVEGINLYREDKIAEIFILEKLDSPIGKDKNIKIQIKWQEGYVCLLVNLLVISL